MTRHSDVPPATLGVELVDGGIVVKYNDGREVFYHGIPRRITGPHLTGPGKDVHILVTDPTDTRGVLIYVDERRTDGDILEDSGVGRVILAEDEATTLFHGVRVQRGSLRYEIEVEHEAIDGRVFVFEEDQFEERAYEIVESLEE